MKCGLLGRKLGHSYSPQIHGLLGDYSYELFEKEPEQLPFFLKDDDFTGINVTIPYKKDVIPYLDELSPAARKIGSVNTIVRRADGSLFGHNSEYFGFVPLLAVVGNMAALWAVSLCFMGGWIACLASLLPLLGQGLAWLCAWLARYILLAARVIASLPGAVVYTETRGLWPWLAASYGLFILCGLFGRKNWLRFGVPGLAAFSAALMTRPASWDR